MILLWILIFIVALAVLIISSDKFTDAAEKIGLHFGIPAFIVGVTIVSIGTSLPELASSIIAVLKGSSEIIIGNVIGSNLANMFLVLGIAAIIGGWKKPIVFKFNLANVDLPIFMGSIFLLGFAVLDGVFSFIEAVIFLIGYIIYIHYSISKIKETEKVKKEKQLIIEQLPKKYEHKHFPLKSVFIIIISSIFIFIGAKYTVDAVIKLSELFGIATEFIALTAVALGTSLPELSVTIAAARRGGFEMALGNVLGSNIFNVFVVMAIPAFIAPLVIPSSLLLFQIPLLIAGSVLVLLMTMDKEMTKWEGMLLILFYLFFLIEIFI